MPTTVQPGDGDASAPLAPRPPLADEAGLKKAFFAQYPALAAEASSELGPDAAILKSKVVEGAFVRAWDARNRFLTAEDLRKFLVDDVHHAAARALSRRAAAARLAGHDAKPAHADHGTSETTIEQSWGHIQHALHGEAHSPQALAEAAALSRHEAAQHITTITKERSIWVALAVGAVLIAALVGVALWLNAVGNDSKMAAAVNSSEVNAISSPAAKIGMLTLNDGSKVRLAPESKLSVPKAFGENLRAVKLEGAASFTVAPGLKVPFQVHARETIIEAKGTAFTVRSFADDDALTIVVTEGTVQVRRDKRVDDITAPRAFIIRDGAEPRTASIDERDAADAWRNGTLAITNQPLRQVLPQLRRWYGLDLKVPDPTLNKRVVTFRASLDSSMQAIHGVERSAGVTFGYVGQQMVFQQAGAGKK